MFLTEKEVIRCRALMTRGKLNADQAAAVVGKGATGADVLRGLDDYRARHRAYRSHFVGAGWRGNIIATNDVTIPDEVAEDALLRAAAPYRSFSHWFTGCPPFGYSELDKRTEAPSIVPRLLIIHDKLDDRMFKPAPSVAREPESVAA